MAVEATAVTGLDTTLDRLEAASRYLAELDETRRVEALRRNTLIIEARDSGASWRTIARRSLVSISRCVAIVSGG